MPLPPLSLSASSTARSGANNRSDNVFSTGDLIAGSSSKGNNYALYALLGVVFLMMFRKGK